MIRFYINMRIVLAILFGIAGACLEGDAGGVEKNGGAVPGGEGELELTVLDFSVFVLHWFRVEKRYRYFA